MHVSTAVASPRQFEHGLMNKHQGRFGRPVSFAFRAVQFCRTKFPAKWRLRAETDRNEQSSAELLR